MGFRHKVLFLANRRHPKKLHFCIEYIMISVCITIPLKVIISIFVLQRINLLLAEAILDMHFVYQCVYAMHTSISGMAFAHIDTWANRIEIPKDVAHIKMKMQVVHSHNQDIFIGSLNSHTDISERSSNTDDLYWLEQTKL